MLEELRLESPWATQTQHGPMHLIVTLTTQFFSRFVRILTDLCRLSTARDAPLIRLLPMIRELSEV